MLLISFSKAGQEDIVLTEDDLFDFQYEASCYSGETFELGGVNARTLYLLIDNNTQRFSRGTFANCRVKLEIDGHFFGYYNSELPKRRNGVIELTAYDDMVKLDTEFPTDYIFPQTFWAVYAQCVFESGLASEVSFDNVVLNGVWNNGIISADYTQYIYANSCRNLVAGMAEWNGGYAHINDSGKLQIDKFSKTVTREYNSGELMELDYSDETVTFSKVKTSQKNKTYEKGTDTGYTLVLKNQYISYGLDDTMFETYLTKISEYYNGFQLTPMSFTLAEPDFDLHVGDRVQVYDEEEQVTITGNVSKIVISGNCSMTVTCGGFENVSSTTNFTPTSYSQVQQSKQEAMNVDAQKLHTKGTNYDAKTDGNGVQFGVGGDDGKEAPFAYLTGTASGGFELSAYGPYLLSVGGNGFAIVNGRSQAQFSIPGAGDGEALRISTTVGGSDTKFIINTGVSINIFPGGFYIDCGKQDKLLSLMVKDGELYFQGKKVLTE